MRRKDREITDITEILKIMKSCDSVNIALMDGDYPYIVPVNFGIAYIDGKVKIYFHGAKKGKKIDLISENSNAAFSMSSAHRLIEGENSCEYTMEFQSVCGKGNIRFIEGDEKMMGLKFLMSQYGGTGKEFDEKVIEAVTVMELTVDEISGKRLRREK